MTEQLLHPSAGKFERDGLPIRVFEPKLDTLIDATARQIAGEGEEGIDKAYRARDSLARNAFKYRFLARSGRREFINLADTYTFLNQVAWEAIERAKEILVAEGRNAVSQLRKLREEPEKRSTDTSQNQGI